MGRHAVPLVGGAIPPSGSAHSARGEAGEPRLTTDHPSARSERPGLVDLHLVTIGQHERAEAPVLSIPLTWCSTRSIRATMATMGILLLRPRFAHDLIARNSFRITVCALGRSGSLLGLVDHRS